MEINEIKKILYKENPTAYFNYIRKGVAYYSARLSSNKIIHFDIPINDMGEADFFEHMPSKHLIRWIAPTIGSFSSE